MDESSREGKRTVGNLPHREVVSRGRAGGNPDSSTEGRRRSWALTKIASTGTIVLRFVGPTRDWEIPEFFSAVTDMMPEENAYVIFDLREVDGHNPQTKAAAKKWLLDNKARLARVTVVVPAAATILKMATAVVSLASGVKIRIRDDLPGRALLPDGSMC